MRSREPDGASSTARRPQAEGKAPRPRTTDRPWERLPTTRPPRPSTRPKRPSKHDLHDAGAGRPEEVPAGEGERLQKVLAGAGFGSRRSIEEMIEAGRITVNGARAVLGQRVRPRDRIEMQGRPVRLPPPDAAMTVLAYHKPPGEIVSAADPEGRPSVFAALPPVRNGRWIAVGRLDFNSSGLLLFTTSGELSARLMHPRHEIEREYAVRTAGQLSNEAREQLLTGLQLEDGLARFGHLDDAGGEGLNHWYRVTLTEGRNREVRRMFEAVGLTVSRLLRTRFGPIELPRDLSRGRWRFLAPAEVAKLARVVGLAVPGASPESRRPGGKPPGSGGFAARRQR